MKPNHLLLTFLILTFAVLNCTGPRAAYAYDPMCEFYEEHNGACCSDCHDMVSCATTNLFCVPSPISTPNSGEKPVVYNSINNQVRGEAPYNGVCEVCHTQTRYHRNNASGDHTHYADRKCTSCHLHGPTTMVSKGLCYTCHGGSQGDVPAGNPPMFASPIRAHAEGATCDSCHGHDGGSGTYISHSTHTEDDSDDLKGPDITCSDCHDTNNYPYFRDVYTSCGADYYKREITIQSSQVEADLTDFPMLFSTIDPDLRTTANGGRVTNSNGYDIVFYDNNDVQLDHEIEKYDGSTGEFVAWVRIPSLSSTTDTVIQIHYGDSGVTTSQENVAGVWSNDYAGVWHLDESPANDTTGHLDSTPNTNHGTPKNFDGVIGSTTDATGKMDGADKFDGNDDYLDCGNGSSLSLERTDPFTISAWIKRTGTGSHDFIVTKQIGPGSLTGYAFWISNVGDGTQNKVEIDLISDNSASPKNRAAVYGSTSITDTSKWYYVVATYDGSSSASGMKIFVDGSLETLTTYYDDLTGTIVNSESLVIGSRVDSPNPFVGNIDEVRISSTTRSPGWIKTSYNNQNSPFTFYVVGTEYCGDDSLPPEVHIDLASTTVCDNCHSTGGAYGGVAMAKASWANGIYESDGKTFKSGKEQWCAGCHDNAPANSKKDGSGINAPNVIGNDSTYGFYITGHKINCLSCHDSSRDHIDGEPRTYYAASNPNNYQDGYRLGSSMQVPTPAMSSRGPAVAGLASLCFDCHNADAVLGSPVVTNFYDGSMHLHAYHFATGLSDSDYDGGLDSAISCIICHNVHGAPNSAMIRHGELISTPGTTNRVPALNFTYHLSGGGTDPYADLQDTDAGDMLYKYVFSDNHLCNDCHTSEYYARTPNLGPDVLDSEASPGTLLPDVATDVLLTARVRDRDDDIPTVTINLSSIGIPSSEQTAMYDDATNGDEISGDGVFSFEISSLNLTAGFYALPITATDGTLTGTGQIDLWVQGENEIIVDNPAATFVGGWRISTGAVDQYGPDVRYHAAGGGGDTATWTPNIVMAGSFRVYAWWIASANRATNAKYTVNHNSGSAEVQVNQQINGGQWNLLGIYNFAAGTSGSVVLSDDANGLVIADAIWWEPIDAYLVSGQITEDSVGLDGITVSLTGDATNSAVTAGGGYYSFPVVDGNYTVTPTLMNYDFTPTSRNVEVTGADVPNQDFDATYNWTVTIIDNPDATFVGGWSIATGAGDQYGSNIQYHASGTGSNTATWTPDIAETGNYRVYAWWSAKANRATNAKYTINYNGGSDPVSVNQQINGGQWNLLGTYPFIVGASGYVQLSDDANGYVIADAIKWELQP